MKKKSQHRYFEILSLLPNLQFRDLEAERRFCELAAIEIRNSLSARKLTELFMAAIQNRPLRPLGRPRTKKPAPAEPDSGASESPQPPSKFSPAPDAGDPKQQPET